MSFCSFVNRFNWFILVVSLLNEFAEKFFRGKLMLALLALLLVIKIIKIKLFWLLPLFIGVGAAKKLVLKFLLFLFPALAQIFKLCSYYHKNYHETRYHHHLHHIDHHHTVSLDIFWILSKNNDTTLLHGRWYCE